MDKITKLLKSGMFTVSPTGEIFKNFKLSRTGNLIPIPPIRADKQTDKGYLRVRWGRCGFVFAHQLVWVAFNGPIPEGKEINHKNGIKSDNNPKNLELTTRGGNIKHAYDHGLRNAPCGESNPNAKINNQIIGRIIQLRESGKRIDHIAEECGINRHTVSLIIKKHLPDKTGHLNRYENFKKQ